MGFTIYSPSGGYRLMNNLFEEIYKHFDHNFHIHTQSIFSTSFIFNLITFIMPPVRIVTLLSIPPPPIK